MLEKTLNGTEDVDELKDAVAVSPMSSLAKDYTYVLPCKGLVGHLDAMVQDHARHLCAMGSGTSVTLLAPSCHLPCLVPSCHFQTVHSEEVHWLCLGHRGHLRVRQLVLGRGRNGPSRG